MKTPLLLSLLCLLAVPVPAEALEKAPTGRWHAALLPPGGREVFFALDVASSRGSLRARLLNGRSELPFTTATWDGGTLTLSLAHLEGRLVLKPVEGGLSGSYSRTVPTGLVEIPVTATRKAPAPPRPARGAPSVSGEWGVELGRDGKTSRLLGVLDQEGGVVRGTFLSTSGDYGPLHGTWDGERLLLTVFDGVFVYRFDGERLSDGSLRGEFRTRQGPPATWTARRLAAEESARWLPGAYDLIRARNPAEPFTFSFPDEEGRTVSSTDERFSGKAMIVTVTGSWCPNCHDEAPVLQDLYRRLAGRGLEVVSLSFEYTDDADRSRTMVKRFRERFGLTYPVLVAGSTKGAAASPVAAQLVGSVGYPTTLFLDRSHRIVKVHAGFDGPATGKRFDRLKAEMAETVERLLAP